LSFTSEKAVIRFGEGLSPSIDLPRDPGDILAQLDGEDFGATLYPIATFSDLLPQMAEIERLRRLSRRARRNGEGEDKQKAYKNAFKPLQKDQDINFARLAGRAIKTDQPFRERLTRFWADHFTVVGKDRMLRMMVPAYMEEAIRPHISGRFADMLKAAILHPMMIVYLDQNASFGPNSYAAKKKRGLNENLARELLELHTLGAQGHYKQADVTQLAKLLTGLTASYDHGFVFQENRAEPGAETVLGRSYGGNQADLSDITKVLDDLATHPDTAAHIARKLAVHFVSDLPSKKLVQAMTDAYLVSSGDLKQVYSVLLEHPDTWDRFGEKIKRPVDYLYSAMRALEVPPKALARMNRKTMRGVFASPMASMGQTWMQPSGPDGWPEDAEAWIGVQGLAARLQWAMSGPSAIFRALPDPNDFAHAALGSLADPRVLFAAKNAETRREGIGLVLASPAFQRR
jgi:uncharacterized protein (DUF1800 family)